MKMNICLKNICLVAIFALPLLTACKKDEEETETKPSLVGSVTFDMPEYLPKNEVITMTAGGIAYPSDIRYSWYSSAIAKDTLALRTVTVRTPDSLGVFSISACGQCEGYYAATTTRSFTTVDPARNGSLKGLAAPQKTFTDPRDGMTYDYVTVGSLDWFAQNLAWDGAGVAFRQSPVMDGLFGRFYHWEDATGGVTASGLGAGPQGVCPKGWSIPTNEDWADLASAVNGGALAFDDKWDGIGEKLSAQGVFNGEKLWPYSPDNLHTNTFGWNALPVGSTSMDHSKSNDFCKYGFWWSATEKGSDQAYFRYIYCDMNSFPMSSSSKTDFGASVRCVRITPAL